MFFLFVCFRVTFIYSLYRIKKNNHKWFLWYIRIHVIHKNPWTREVPPFLCILFLLCIHFIKIKMTTYIASCTSLLPPCHTMARTPHMHPTITARTSHLNVLAIICFATKHHLPSSSTSKLHPKATASTYCNWKARFSRIRIARWKIIF